MLTSLRAAHPDAEIDWLVRTEFADSIRAHPALNRAIPFPRKELARAFWRGRPDRTLSWLNTLRRRRYDLVLDCQGLLRSGGIARWTGAGTRVGDRRAREGAWLAYTRRVRTPQRIHTVDRMHMLALASGGAERFEMALYPPREDAEAMREAAKGLDPALRLARPQDAWRSVARKGAFDEPYALLAPTSIWPGKRWPIDRFASLATSLLESGQVARIVVAGGPGEESQCAPLLAMSERSDRIVNLVGATSIGGLMAIIQRASLVVACDSAAAHIAVGFNRPLVALYGPTDIGLVGPYGREEDALQHVGEGDRLDHKNASLGLALMERISVDEAAEACLVRLSRSSPRSPS